MLSRLSRPRGLQIPLADPSPTVGRMDWSFSAASRPTCACRGLLPAQASDADEVSVDLGTVQFAVAISIGLAHERNACLVAMTVGDRLRSRHNPVAVGVVLPEGSDRSRIILHPLLSGELTVRVCVGSSEDDVDQILGRLAAGKFSVMVRVGKGKIVVRDRDRPDDAEIAASPGASPEAQEGRGDQRQIR